MELDHNRSEQPFEILNMAKKPRNPAARSPLLRKGGAHRKSKSSERMKSKNTLRKEVDQNTFRPPKKED
jgi:hypothetical protein